MRRISSNPPVMVLWTLFAIAVCSLLPSSPPRAGTDAHPDMSGTWLLNEELSDDIEAKLRQARIDRRARMGSRSPGGMGGVGMGRGGSGGGGMGRGGWGGGGMGRDGSGGGGVDHGDGVGMGRGSSGGRGASGMPPGGGRRPGERDPAEMRSRMQRLVQGFDVLIINQEEPMLSIRYADDRRRAFRTDGKKQSRKTVDGAVITRAKWEKNGLLSVITSTARGRESTETYELIIETDQLRLITATHERAGMPSLELVRVYDRQSATAGDESGSRGE